MSLHTSIRRRRFSTTVLAGLVAASLLTGCSARRVTVVHHDPGARVVVVKKGHVHSARCGHYKHGNTWYVVKGHVHGKGCGHHKVRGVWVLR